MEGRIKIVKSQIADLKALLLDSVGSRKIRLIEEIANAQFELASLHARSIAIKKSVH
jgi:hypothetical protein